MARFTNPMDLLRHQTGLMRRVEAKAKAMHRAHVRKVATVVVAELLSGSTTTAQLRRMGHPFGRRTSKRGYQRFADKKTRVSVKTTGRNAGAGVGIAKLPINRQTGDLVRSLRMRAVPGASAAQSLELGFIAPYAKFVLAKKGTRRMVPRGYQAAKKKIDNRLNKELQRDLRRMILTAAVTGKA